MMVKDTVHIEQVKHAQKILQIFNNDIRQEIFNVLARDDNFVFMQAVHICKEEFHEDLL